MNEFLITIGILIIIIFIISSISNIVRNILILGLIILGAYYYMAPQDQKDFIVSKEKELVKNLHIEDFMNKLNNYVSKYIK